MSGDGGVRHGRQHGCPSAPLKVKRSLVAGGASIRPFAVPDPPPPKGSGRRSGPRGPSGADRHRWRLASAKACARRDLAPRPRVGFARPAGVHRRLRSPVPARPPARPGELRAPLPFLPAPTLQGPDHPRRLARRGHVKARARDHEAPRHQPSRLPAVAPPRDARGSEAVGAASRPAAAKPDRGAPGQAGPAAVKRIRSASPGTTGRCRHRRGTG